VPALGDSRLWWTFLVLLVAVQRLAELRLSSRNARRLLARGGVEAGRGHMPLLVALHVGFLTACPLEVWGLDRPLRWWLAAPALVVLILAQVLRIRAIRALGERWSVRVIVVPGAAPVESGPYRHIRHPNYLAVILEIASIPLIHGAWIAAAVFSALNGAALALRIHVEERLLRQVGSPSAALDARPRFVPHA
jgi:methyltransferase